MIDWDRVNQLKDEIGEEDFQEVVDMFLDEMNEEVDSLTPGMGAQDLEAKLHFLKGAALNLGFSAFADLCKTGEEAARDGQTDAIDTAAVMTCYKKSIDAFGENAPGSAAA
ncbi:MAG: Hpt domain-containing protein [Pseudomonadota bacterium]